MDPRPTPHSVIFFANGLAAVFDRDGNQIPHYQSGGSHETIRKLKEDGHDWYMLPEVLGTPGPVGLIESLRKLVGAEINADQESNPLD